jgi:TolB-like protein/Tfp pilus assembly protein PilF
MSDVFVSYKAEDRRRVEPLVEGLQADGLSVWWDAHIGGGDSWREKIEGELESARCVIVVWSKRSIGSEGRFVRDEASRAQRRGVYLPVLIDRIEPPLGFGETQAVPLYGWKGDRTSPRYQAILDCARAVSRGEVQALPRHVEPIAPLDRRTLVAGGAAVAVVAAAGGWFLLKPGAADASESIAVLPFANLSGDPSQAYFSDGLAEELRSALGRIPRLKVIGRTSSEMVRNSDAIAAANKLGVANVVTGSVRRSPDLIRVAAQLVSGKDGVEQWSQVYDRTPGDILRIQSDIAKNVADALSLELGGALVAGGTHNAGAQDLYLKAISVREAGISEANLRESIKLFDQAIQLDPDFADAYAQKSDTLVNLIGIYSNTVTEFDRGYNEAAAIARRAIELAPQRALGHSSLASALAGKLNVRGAASEYRRASELLAGEVPVLIAYSFFMSKTGNPEEGLRAADKAISLDPLNAGGYAMRGTALLYAHRYADAADSFREGIKVSREPAALAFTMLGNALTLLGQADEARKAFARAPADTVYRLTGEAILDARGGDRAAATRKLDRLRETFGDSAAYQQAQVLAQLAQPDQALAALERSWEVRDPGLLRIAADPFLDPVRRDPRFAVVERKMGLPLGAH